MIDSYPAPYSPTGYGIHDGEAVVRTPHTVKTLRGDDVEAIVALLAEMDGDTAASDLVEQIPNASDEYVELLYDNGLVYDARAIPAALADAGCGQLLEPVLPSVSPESHQALPDLLGSAAVDIFDYRDAISPVISRLRAAGVSVNDTEESDGSATEESDVIVLSERLERSESWSEANEQWAAGDATLVKTRLTERGWRLGPVLTADAPACLNCVYRRVDANRAGGRLFTETVGDAPPYVEAYTDTVTELLFRTLLGQVPRYLDEQFVVYDHYDGTVETPRVFALPHCEVCDSA